MRYWLPMGIFICWFVLAAFGPLFPLMPDHIELSKILLSPGHDAMLGYDDLGRPLWDRLVVGARVSFFVSLMVVTISLIIGTLIGATSAYIGGWFDHVIIRIVDIFLAFPGLLLAIALAGLMGPGLNNIVIALSVIGWVGFARLTRAQIMALKDRDHVHAARALGAGRTRIIMHHLLPLVSAPLIVEATFAVASVVIAEAGLSFLGLGIQPPDPSWGSMIRDGTRYMLVAPHMVLVPGIALLLVVLSVNLLGDRLRDRMDVRS